MKKVRAAACLLLALTCASCSRSNIGPNGVPVDLVPAGFEVSECRFEDFAPGATGDQEGLHWQRLVCQHKSARGSDETAGSIHRA
jgi:hypothetical protein